MGARLLRLREVAKGGDAAAGDGGVGGGGEFEEAKGATPAHQRGSRRLLCAQSEERRRRQRPQLAVPLALKLSLGDEINGGLGRRRRRRLVSVIGVKGLGEHRQLQQRLQPALAEERRPRRRRRHVEHQPGQRLRGVEGGGAAVVSGELRRVIAPAATAGVGVGDGSCVLLLPEVHQRAQPAALEGVTRALGVVGQPGEQRGGTELH